MVEPVFLLLQKGSVACAEKHGWTVPGKLPPASAPPMLGLMMIGTLHEHQLPNRSRVIMAKCSRRRFTWG